MNDTILKSIAEQYGTPAYVYHGDKIISQYEFLKNSLPQRFEIFYSMKANPLLGICQLFKNLGSGIEVASSGELHMALAAGFLPKDIIFTSPGKNVEELEYAIDTKIYSINVESLAEAELISQIAEKKSLHADISLRINPDFDFASSSIKMSGIPTQFGIDQVQLKKVFHQLKLLPNINIIGIHVYTGTQMLHAQNIIQGMEETIKLALELQDTYGFSLKFVDLGGGFGIPYFKGDALLQMESLKEGLEAIWAQYGKKLAQIRVVVESGRFLMAESGVFMTKALYKKLCKGSRYIVCDGGSSLHASSAFLGRHIRNNFPMHVLNKTGNEEEVNIVGPLCTPTDVLGQKVLLPQIATGDILIVEKSGAYGLTQSPALFLSHRMPQEILYYKGNTIILRERGNKEDFMKGQNPLYFQ